MDFYAWNQGFSNYGSFGDDETLMNLSEFSGEYGNVDGLFMKSCQSLVLDEEKGELVKAEGKVIGKKMGMMSDEKALAALKSHSEAERRRRERINAHLDTLRGLVPSTDKMDKATLLAEVIRQVQLLKTNATEASVGLLIPEDVDELKIEKLDEAAENGGSTFHVSFCCKHRPELLTDIRRSLASIKVNIERSELSTLGDHVKIIFDFTRTDTSTTDKDIVSSVREALNSVIEKASISPEYAPRAMLPNKRRRYCL